MTSRASTAPWPRSVAGSPAPNAGPDSSTTCALCRNASCAGRAGGAARTTRKKPRQLKSTRHAYGGAQAAERAVAESDVAAMGTRDIARDRQPQSGAALVLIARIVQPQERFEHFLAHIRRNAGPVVVHRNCEITVVAVGGDRD